MKLNLNFSRWRDLVPMELWAGAGALGVNLDRAALTLVQVQKGLSGAQIRNFAQLPLPEGGWEALTPLLKEQVNTWNVRQSPVALTASRHLGFLRQVTLPKAVQENLAQVMAYELDRFVPLPADRVYFDYQVVQETETELRLLLMALPREPVDACLDALVAAGLNPVAVELAPLAAANAFTLLNRSLPDSWLLMHPTPGSLEFLHLWERFPESWRTVPVSDPQVQLLLTLAAEMDRLGEPGKRPQAVCLYGFGLHPFEMDDLGSQVDAAIYTPDAFRIDGLPAGPEAELAVLPALGAALRGLGKVPLGTNLLPPESRAEVKMGGIFLTKILLLLFLGLVCAWAGSSLVHSRVLLYQVESRIEELTPEARRVEKLMEENRALAKKLQGLRTRLDQSPNKLLILKELTKLVPEHTWLFHFHLSQNSLEISGASKSAADLIPLLEKSGWITKTEFASPIVTDASKLEHFKIKAEIKGLELGS